MSGPTDRIRELADEGMSALEEAKTESDLLNVKGRYFGKKGAISEFLKGVASLAVEDRKQVGQAANEARARLEGAFESRLAGIREAERRAREGLERLDVTLRGRSPAAGSRHPIAQTMAEIIAVFQRLGFSVRGGPDVETDYYNFEALNIPKANPVWISGSYPTNPYTAGSIMPQPRISSQPDPLHTRQPDPPQMTQRMSTSADGSVNGKKLGRNRSGFPGPNIIPQNSVRSPLRSAIVMSRSTAKPSTWWNMGLWVMSESQR